MKQHVPTLTEVVPLEAPAPAAPITLRAEAELLSEGPPALDEAQVAQRVLEDLQRQVDLLVEHRLREALAPALARVADALVQEARAELALTLRDVVARAVALELARRRER